MKIGDKLKGQVAGLQPYGAFIALDNGITGLVHISEIKTGYIDNIHHSLTVGQEVQVQIIDLDEFSGKISLSLRSLEEEKRRQTRKNRFTTGKHRTGFEPLKKALPAWTEEALAFLNQGKMPH